VTVTDTTEGGPRRIEASSASRMIW
jgi:hypothetical protein